MCLVSFSVGMPGSGLFTGCYEVRLLKSVQLCVLDQRTFNSKNQIISELMNSKMKCLPIYPYLSVRDRAEAVAARPSSTPPPLYRNTRGSVPLLSQYTPTLRMWWSMTISLLFITSLTDSPQQQPVAQTPLLYFTTHAHCQKKMVITHNR